MLSGKLAAGVLVNMLESKGVIGSVEGEIATSPV